MPKAEQRPPSGEVRNVERLRHAINAGKSGDKRPMRDPAAAPLGTDEEAGGTPPTPEQVAEAAQHEMAQRVLREGDRTSNAVILIVILLIAVATVGAVVWTYG
jgi:hypothetical protein